jgi:hypothetical protein
MRQKDHLEFSIGPLLDALEQANKYLFLIVDEFDMFYEQNPDRYQLIGTTLSELSGIGNNNSGRMATVLCGSSSNLQVLIRKNTTPQLVQDYPALTCATNLNETKFATRRIEASSPVDVEATREIVNACMKTNITRQNAKIITFVAGTTPREVQRVLEMTSADDMMNKSADNNSSGANTMKNVSLKHLWNGIMNKSVEKNMDLLNLLYHHRKLDFKFVQLGDWPDRLNPLSFDEVASVWKDTPNNDDWAVSHALFHLSDRNWCSVHGMGNSFPKHIYPVCVLDLIKFHKTELEQKSLFADANFAIQNTLANPMVDMLKVILKS